MRFAVGGIINVREVKVRLDARASFVFKVDYKSPQLEDVFQFIKNNHH
ncbi:MAG: hypothetical protein ABJL44_10695 [Algibacter sp.]